MTDIEKTVEKIEVEDIQPEKAPYIITKQKQLKTYLEQIKDEKVIFLDTEFHRQTTYYSKLCLIQIATEDTLVAIDPLENQLDLSILMKFLRDDSIIKVFHACKQDLEIFYHLNNKKPLKNIFDTQIAALALGLGDQIGYANLVKSLLNVRLDKSQQIANWINRPMSEEQIKYALDDVVYLKKIFYIMVKQLEKKNRAELISDELKALSHKSSFTTDDQSLYKGIKMRDNNPLTLTILQRLAIFREKQARDNDKTRNSIMHDDFLAHCAMLKPKNEEEILAIRSVRSKFVKKYGNDIIKIIEDVKHLDARELVTCDKTDRDSQLPVIDSSIKDLANLIIKIKAQEHSISTRLITNNSELSIFLSGKKVETKLHKSWRWDMFGKYLDALKKGNLSIGVKNNKITFNTLDEK